MGRPKQELPANAPADETRDLPWAYTSFHPPPFVNAKNVSSSYLKTEAQTWAARSGRPAKRAKRDEEEGAESEPAEEEGENPVARRLVIHIGSDAVRVGRATDLYPTVVPNVLARRMTTETPPRASASTTASLESLLEPLRAELRMIMRQYKLRPVSNGWQSANSYNASVQPERVEEHNDVYDVGFRADADVPPNTKVVVGDEALRLASLSSGAPTPWRLHRPWARGMLNVQGYADMYGAACVEVLLNDVQHILTHALTAPPSGGGASLTSAGLGIPAQELSRYSVLSLVPDSFSRSDVRALGHVLMRHMGFAALHVQTEGLCATFGAGLSAACVVDLGATSIGIACVEEGLVLPETRITLSYGGRDMSAFFLEALRGSSFPYHECDLAKRVADAQLLDQLKERFATLQPSQVGLNLFDFLVRLPGAATQKYALRLYDEPILAGLMLFHPSVVPDKRLPRRARTSAATDAIASDEPEPNAVLTATNASLGGDEAAELSVHAAVDVTPTLAMLGCLGARLPDAAAAHVDPARAAPESAAAASPAPDVGEGSARPSPAPENAKSAKAALAVPQTSAMATQAAKCAAAATAAAAQGLDVVSEAACTPLDRAVLHSLLASTGTREGALGTGSEERLRRLANNIVCIGGAARIAGLNEALEARVSMLLAEHYTPSDSARAPAVPVPAHFVAPQAVVIPPPRNLDPASLAWKGLAVLAHLDTMQELWVQAADWDTFGYRALKEKSLFL
ncbi:actin-like protein arp8 [Malassezia caprae]|uniref:Actin-like protein arp8 n=1 Tax=Malassezia caprae TaxID=1381934 RepID=A0AAF0IWV8_9BASI|nr:actin-like protein arp8 [Malassezia caprae]